MTRWRYGAFLFALILYAVMGSPTPDAPGWGEALIGLALAAACGVGGLHFASRAETLPSDPSWAGTARLLFLCGLILPIVPALCHSNEVNTIFRDIVAFCFFMLPLLLFPLITQQPSHRQKWLLYAVLFIGLAFAFKALADLWLTLIGVNVTDELYYFANVPSVLFAALLLLGLTMRELAQPQWIKALPKSALCIVLSALPLTAMILAVQRASLGGIALSLLFWLALLFIASPSQALRVSVIFGGLALFISPFLSGLYDLLSHKTLLVGVNMRGQELMAVWQEITRDHMSFLIGVGWGGTFQSPAVGGLEVNFTHSLLSAMLLKTGIVGFGLTLAFLVALIRPFLILFKQDSVLALALAVPLLINVVLYASYKSLDFGLLLLLLVGTAQAVRDKSYTPLFKH